jgi:PAS domain S-box-containing protein
MTEPTTGAVAYAEVTPPDLLEAQKRALEMIVQNVPLADILGCLCRIVEEQASASVRAAILLVTPDGGHLTTGAAPGLPESYSRAIDGIGISAFVGTCAAAAARRHVIITPDIANDPAWHRFKHLPLSLGLQAAWSMPIFSSAGAVLGTFGTYFTEEREPTAAERQLVEVLSRTAALAIERQRSDEALKRSEARYRAMVEASPECVKVVAADGTLLQANAAGLRIMEAEHESEVRGLSVYDALVPEDRQRYREFNDRVCRGGESASLRFTIVTRSGRRRTMESNAVPFPVAGGEFAQLSVTRDVTEQRAVHAAVAADLKDTRLLRDLAARLISDEDVPSLFDEILAAAMAITEADAGTIQLLHQQSQVLTFLALRGFSPDMRAHFDRVDATSHSPCGVALASGNRFFVVFDDPNTPDPDGSNKLHLDAGMRCAQSMPLVSRSGKPLGMFSTYWREHRRLTERELRFLDLLGRQAADLIERTQSQEALRASEKQLREADRRKDEFIAVLAHELRNPLVPIRTGVELLKSVRERPALIDTIRPMMERQVGHMVRLIDDLLDVSRITSGKIELRRQPVLLASVVGSAIEANRAAIASGGLELATNLEDPHRIIEVDPTRFSQVISNLVQNATKFTATGGKITISAAVDSATSLAVPELVLKVSDTGIGIEAQHLPRVFDLFAQAHPGGYDRHAGLGIGLALARSLVQLHGGTITASSAGIGKGSVFTVRVPAPILSPTAAADSRGLRSLGGLRVLVVDDNRDAADAMTLLISQLGGDARVAYDGLSALAALEEFPASVVLLDIGMPGLDGYQTCQHIREKLGAAICLVAVTGWGQEQDRQLAAQAGFDTHMTKPADPQQLAELLGARARIN